MVPIRLHMWLNWLYSAMYAFVLMDLPQQGRSMIQCQDLFVCFLRRMYSVLFFPFCQSFSIEAPVLHAWPSQTVFDFLSQRHYKLCHFISDIMDSFWMVKTSNKPISLTTWLGVN